MSRIDNDYLLAYRYFRLNKFIDANVIYFGKENIDI